MRHLYSILVFVAFVAVAVAFGGCKVQRQQVVETRYEQVHDTCYLRETVTATVHDTCYIEREAAAVVTFAEGGGTYNHLTGEAVGVASVTLTEREAAQLFHVEHSEASKDSTAGTSATTAESREERQSKTDGGRWWVWFTAGMFTACAVGVALKIVVNRFKII